MKRLLSVLVVGVIGIWLGQAAPRVYAHGSVPFGDLNDVHACVKQVGGQLRQITSGNCLPSELIDHWNRIGPQGQQGGQGTPGISGYETLVSTIPFDKENQKLLFITCPGVKRLLSCFANIDGPQIGNYHIREIMSNSELNQCRIEARENPEDDILEWQLEGRAICATVD